MLKLIILAFIGHFLLVHSEREQSEGCTGQFPGKRPFLIIFPQHSGSMPVFNLLQEILPASENYSCKHHEHYRSYRPEKDKEKDIFIVANNPFRRVLSHAQHQTKNITHTDDQIFSLSHARAAFKYYIDHNKKPPVMLGTDMLNGAFPVMVLKIGRLQKDMNRLLNYWGLPDMSLPVSHHHRTTGCGMNDKQVKRTMTPNYIYDKSSFKKVRNWYEEDFSIFVFDPDTLPNY